MHSPLALTEREAAKALGISPRKLWGLRSQGEIRCVKIGRSVRYAVTEIQRFLDEQMQKSKPTILKGNIDD